MKKVLNCKSLYSNKKVVEKLTLSEGRRISIPSVAITVPHNASRTRCANTQGSRARKCCRQSYIRYTADDTVIVMIQTQGVGSEAVHKLAWDAFAEGMEVAKS